MLFNPQPNLSAMLSTQAPPSETTQGQAGSAQTVARGDHTHPRISSTHTGTLNASAEDSITFTTKFAVKPSWSDSWEEASEAGVVVIKVKSWVQDAEGNYTGCTIKGYRSRSIPQNLVSLLVGAVYDIFGASASGVSYSMIFIKKS